MRAIRSLGPDGKVLVRDNWLIVFFLPNPFPPHAAAVRDVFELWRSVAPLRRRQVGLRRCCRGTGEGGRTEDARPMCGHAPAGSGRETRDDLVRRFRAQPRRS